MNGETYRSIKLKGALVDSVEQFITSHPEQGYKSIADFVTDAVREKLLELNARLGARCRRRRR